MKKILILSLSFLFSICSCQSVENSSEDFSDKPVEETNLKDIMLDEDYSTIKSLSELDKKDPDSLMYDDEVFGEFYERSSQQLYLNNKINNEMFDGMVKENDDAKYLFYSDDKMRFVNRSEGYAFNLSTDKTFVGDFSIGGYRSKLFNQDSTITITKETRNPYKSWTTYRNEWLIRYINNPEYVSDNNMVYSHNTILENTDIKPGFYTSIFSIEIKDPGNIKKMHYNIGILRDEDDFYGKEFYLFVMKSTSDRYDDFQNMLKSFMIIDSHGSAKNQLDNMSLIKEEKWDEGTLNYFNKFSTQDRTDWGIYTANTDRELIIKSKLSALEEAMDYTFDIIPTYQHVLTASGKVSFPTASTISVAGGNGFNGKKVLQFSYQFTSNNNDVGGSNATDCYTPMFDILRGKPKVDDFFDKRCQIYSSFEMLANGLKEYKEPVLFRLNNEMNTDWTSYCGLMTLVDPDIFAATWRCLYNYFKENNVTNTIWIFNPISKTIPYSYWGEDLCYFPGNKYVHAFGLTEYQDNNSNTVNSTTFRKDYTNVYNKNYSTWKNFPWIISEFGCGSGGSASGERYRNQSSQADYVTGMFLDFNNREECKYLQNIKGAVWFSVNDSAGNKVTNQYELVIDKLPLTIAAFKEGLKNNK